MAWTTLRYSKGQVDRAGRLLASGQPLAANTDEALDILNNWRAAHSFPLNTLQLSLRPRAAKVYREAIVAQRLKRVQSIVGKLRRNPSMNLSRMQDVGGCRAIVESVGHVRRLAQAHKRSSMLHPLVNMKDYIAVPKTSGYRGIHLIYKYHSEKYPEFCGFLIEIQLRSRLQHAWATAVETVGTFLQQSLKASEGPEEWLRFFTLVSSAFAIEEKTPLVPGAATDAKGLYKAIRGAAKKLRVKATLGAYGAALKFVEEKGLPGAHYYLMHLKPKANVLTVWGYESALLTNATQHYLDLEKTPQEIGAQTVLVAADSLKNLKRSYPNFFLDTDVFMKALDRVLAEG